MPTGLLSCAVFAVATLLVGVLLRRWRPELSADAVKLLRKKNERREMDGNPPIALDQVRLEIAHFGAIAAISVPLWTVLGLWAVYLLLCYCFKYDNLDPLNFENDPDIMTDADLQLHNQCVFIGELFLGYILFMTVMWCIGWDDGCDTIVHHIAFICITFLQGQYGCMVKLGLAAIMMELSTPALYGMLVFRQIAGRGPDGAADPDVAHPIADICAPVFAVLFIVTRVFCFGWQLWETVVITAMHWSTVFPGKPNSLPAYQGMTLLVLYTFGWAMQLFWAKTLVQKMLRKFRGPEPRPPQGEDYLTITEKTEEVYGASFNRNTSGLYSSPQSMLVGDE